MVAMPRIEVYLLILAGKDGGGIMHRCIAFSYITRRVGCGGLSLGYREVTMASYGN